MSRGAWLPGGGPDPALNLAFSFTANAGMVSDEELEQMLDSGQSEVFVSNVSGHACRPLPVWPFTTEGILRPEGNESLCLECRSKALAHFWAKGLPQSPAGTSKLMLVFLLPVPPPLSTSRY